MWIRICDSSHGAECLGEKPESSLLSSGRIYLIDVMRYCIVPAPSVVNYITLSYVRVDVAASCTIQANLGILFEDHALAQNTPQALTIPATYRCDRACASSQPTALVGG